MSSERTDMAPANEVESMDPLLDREFDPARLKRIIVEERKYNEDLLGALDNLKRRLIEMENMPWWRLRLKFQQYRSNFEEHIKGTKSLTRLKQAITFLVERGSKILLRSIKTVFRSLYIKMGGSLVGVRQPDGNATLLAAIGSGDDYASWQALNMPRPVDLADYLDRLKDLSFQPKVSILLPVHNPSLQLFKQTLNSIREQVYRNWELCIADDASTDRHVNDAIASVAALDHRIKIVSHPRKEFISAALNSALELATGEYGAILGQEDMLSPDAIYQNILALNRDPGIDLLYSDEDFVHADGRHVEPVFKPDWCPDNLLSRNYVGNLAIVRTSLLKDLRGFRVGFEGAQDHDVLLRLTERTQRIHHIPRVLYHRRKTDYSATGAAGKPHARESALRAIEEALQRRDEPGRVEHVQGMPGNFLIRYAIQKPGRVSILIPTKDNAKVLETCLESLFTRTNWHDFEVILIDNNSEEASTANLLERYRAAYPDRFRVLCLAVPFNFSLLMNAAAAEAQGVYLLLLNNDTEVIHGDWLDIMMEQAQRPSIGCVGVKLLYPDNCIQHSGVILGRGSLTEHVFRRAHRDALVYGQADRLITNYSALTAACMMLRRDVFRQVGGFDEALAVDFNDVDFCLRVREAGYHNIYLPHVTLYHHESLTRGNPHATAESRRRIDKEETLIKRRWRQIFERDPCLSPHLTRGERDLRINLEPQTFGKAA